MVSEKLKIKTSNDNAPKIILRMEPFSGICFNFKIKFSHVFLIFWMVKYVYKYFP